MKISIFLDVDLNRNGVGSYFNDLAKFYIEKKNEVKIYNSEGESKIISSIKFPNDKTQKIYILQCLILTCIRWQPAAANILHTYPECRCWYTKNIIIQELDLII